MNDTNANQSVRYDSSATGANVDDRHSLQTYVSDALALERHIAEPVDRQTDIADSAKYTDALRIISTIKGLTDSHISALDSQLQALGGHAGSPVKSAWSSLLGGAAAAIDSVRKTKVSKSLRDDYTALSLASISYTMLHATALSLGDQATATLAKRHLDDYASVIIDISRTIPVVVLQELLDDGENVQLSAAELTQQATQDSWNKNS